MVIKSTAFEKNGGAVVARQILVRKYTATHPEKIFETLRDNPDRFNVHYNGTDFSLAKKEFELLYLLAAKAGRVFFTQRNFEPGVGQ